MEYTGTGLELFLGALIVGVLIVIPLVLAQSIGSLALLGTGVGVIVIQIFAGLIVLLSLIHISEPTRPY